MEWISVWLAATFGAAMLAPPAYAEETTDPRTNVEHLAARVDAIDPATFPYANLDRAQALAADVPTGPFDQVVLHHLRVSLQRLGGGDAEGALSRLNGVRKLLEQTPDVPPGLWKVFWETYGIAALRLGEQKNCLGHHGAESCVLPLRGGGVHMEPGPANVARNCFLRCLEEFGDPTVADRWLLNIAAMATATWPDGVPEQWRVPPETFAPETDFPVFADIAPAAGVAASGLSGGSALDDFDGDGDLDLVVSSWGLRDPLRYFRNDGVGEDGTPRFTERSSEAGFDGQWGGLNLIHGDYDNDGDYDLYILRGAWLGQVFGRLPNSLLRNDGHGRFTDVTIEAGLFDEWPTHSAAFGDLDLDGDLDLVVAVETFPGEKPVPARFYRNRGDGTFEDVAEAAGLAFTGLVKGITLGDVDNDGDPDLYASRWGEPNLLLVQTGIGSDGLPHYEDRTAAAGVAEPIRSFPTWFFDYDQDGDEDLFVASFGGFEGDNLEPVARDILGMPSEGERCRLYRNRG
ncbi:MAG: VCBS repeat-containing protein, partial [Gemmatimonadetes bacterium]|nr:VCBS repeat-containing protein [Gemmatimonadota bacterium]